MHGQNISLSIQTFEILIQENRIYVDKTGDIHTLLTSGLRACFFSRPRRFGKSLTISTLDAIFTGKKHLFENLAISKTDYAWPIHPVIRLDMKYAANETLERAEIGLMSMLGRIARLYQITIDRAYYADYFEELIQTLYQKTGQKVVILIDEYDKPLIDNLDNMVEAQKIQGLLKRFYGVLKSADEFIRFVFITGVSKFSKVSVFSDLNHLQDLTMNPLYATLVGMTETELMTHYSPYIQDIAAKKNWASDQVIQEIRRWYNGYRFSESDLKVYNPWSTLSLFSTGKFQEHWYTTGIPKMLIDIINRNRDAFSKTNPADFDLTAPFTLNQFEAYDIEKLELIPLMLQTGFLTLKTYEDIPGQLTLFQLGYPNSEVRNAFIRMILDERVASDSGTRALAAYRIQQAIKQKDFDALITLLNSLIASIPGNLHTSKESYYHSLIHMIFQTSGLTIRSEEWVAGGRIDTVIEEPDCFYIIEFKFGATAQVAIDQIKHRKYSDKFKSGSLPIFALGIAVECTSKSISEWKLEPVSQPLL